MHSLSSSPSPGRDGGVEVRDAGDEGHVHGGRRLPAAGTTATTGAGGRTDSESTLALLLCDSSVWNFKCIKQAKCFETGR